MRAMLSEGRILPVRLKTAPSQSEGLRGTNVSEPSCANRRTNEPNRPLRRCSIRSRAASSPEPSAAFARAKASLHMTHSAAEKTACLQPGCTGLCSLVAFATAGSPWRGKTGPGALQAPRPVEIQPLSDTTLSASGAGDSCSSSALREISSLCSVMYFE